MERICDHRPKEGVVRLQDSSNLLNYDLFLHTQLVFLIFIIVFSREVRLLRDGSAVENLINESRSTNG